MNAREAHQMELEKLYNKNQLLKRVRAEFIECKEVSFPKYIVSKGIPEAFGIDLLAQMALHKRASLPIMVGCLQHLTRDPQECADLLYLCAEADLIDWDPVLETFIVCFTISAHVQEELDRFQFPLPMVVLCTKGRCTTSN